MCVFVVNIEAFQHTFVPSCETAAHCALVFLLFAIILSAAVAYSDRRKLRRCVHEFTATEQLPLCRATPTTAVSVPALPGFTACRLPLLLLLLFSYLSLH